MGRFFKIIRSAGVCGLIDETPGGGAMMDIDAPRNLPLKSPELYLPNVHWHNALDYLEVAFDEVVSISHGTVAGAAGPSGVVGSQVFAWSAAVADRLLLTHELGYEPDVLVTVGGIEIDSAYPIQVIGDGRTRYVSVYVTSTEVRLAETASVTSSALAAVSVDYRVMVLKRKPAPSSNKMFEVVAGVTILDFGRWRSDRRYLQVVPGGSPFSIPYGRTADANNGAVRLAAGSSVVDPVPGYQVRVTPGTGAYGSPLSYGGSFAAPPSIQVQAP